MIEKLSLTPEEIENFSKVRKTEFNKTAFNFLKVHKGLRPNKIHFFLGIPSGGKSTLRNSIIFDFCIMNPNKKVFLWLSEEKLTDFKEDVSVNEKISDALKNVTVFSEQDKINLIKKNPFEKLKELVLKSQPDLFVFDNLTTSSLYGNSFNQQEEFLHNFKSFIQKQNCSTVVMGHTSTNVREHSEVLIDQNDVRGTKTIVNLTEFFYVMQTFKISEKIFTTLRITKSRGFGVNSKLYALSFDEKIKAYGLDVELTFEEFNKLYERQNRLKKTRKR